jgi:ABC-type branched-subunit amino acid transport system substrate-binding protein
MKAIGKSVLIMVCIFSLMFLTAYNPSVSIAAKADKPAKVAKAAKADPIDQWQAKPNAAYDASKMGDWAGFDPATVVSPTGDTIKIAIVAPFSGPAALNGSLFWSNLQWVAYDINKRGGIFVDGKKKLVEIIKADTMNKPDQTKKICERMVLQEKVHALWGTTGSHIQRIMNETAEKY